MEFGDICYVIGKLKKNIRQYLKKGSTVFQFVQ